MTTKNMSIIEFRYGDDWVRSACLHAREKLPYAFSGCYKARGHYGPCEHEPPQTLCRHRDGMYPCHGIHGEHCKCPVRDQDPGDEG